ncbi:hypothetical protein AHAS_Ahas04G0107700 [Arachis hypogaea]
MVAIANVENTIEANAAVTLQDVQRLGQPAENENGNGKENANDNAEGNGDNTGGVLMTLVTFLKAAFYKKYFPESAREAKEMELMQLKQCSLMVADYTSKFKELCRFSRVCQGALKTYKSWKCIKYQRGLKDNIMTAVAHMKIHTFSYLVNKARVVEEYAKTVAASKETHGGNYSRGRGKYFHPRGPSFKRGGYAPQGQGGFRKNTQDQFQRGKGRGNQSKNFLNLTCVRCGRFHPYDSCKIGLGGCFNCGFPSHIARDYTRGKNPNAGQVEELGLKVSELAFDLHVHTPHQTVITRSGCRQVGFKLEGRDFVHDLICLPMVGLEMILEFDWLSKNRVLLDCFER